MNWTWQVLGKRHAVRGQLEATAGGETMIILRVKAPFSSAGFGAPVPSDLTKYVILDPEPKLFQLKFEIGPNLKYFNFNLTSHLPCFEVSLAGN